MTFLFLIQKFLQSGAKPDDTDEERVRKSSMLLMATLFVFAGLIWGMLYFINDLILSSLIPFFYGLLSAFSIAIFSITKKFAFFRFNQIIFILLLPFLLQLSLGGFIASGSIILWALISPLAALVFCRNPVISQKWFIAYIFIIIVAFALNDYAVQNFKPAISDSLVNNFFLMNILGVSAMVFIIQYYFVNQQYKLKKLVDEKNAQIIKQKQQIEAKNKEVLASIHYARLIQEAILPKPSEMREYIPDIFILYKPKDIVSGDFYWFALKGKKSIIAACDCTGHGVPGALVSMVGNDLLNQIIIERNIDNPSEILKKMHDGVVNAFGQRTRSPYSSAIRDGMDIALCTIDMDKKEVLFSGAIRPMWLITKNGANHPAEFKRTMEGDYELVQVKGDRFGIGGVQVKLEPSFTTHKLMVQKGDTIYMSSDGYPDQFGGPEKKDKQFSNKRLLKLLLSIQHLSMDEQKQKLENEIEKWRGEYEQTDDICVIGIRI